MYGLGSVRKEDDKAKRDRLKHFWGFDVDSPQFFLNVQVQDTFKAIFELAGKYLNVQVVWDFMFGEGPYGESGGFVRSSLDTKSRAQAHILANTLAYLLQQTTLYYYIGLDCFVSRCRGPWSDARDRRPVACDWTCVNGWSEWSREVFIETMIGQSSSERLTALYQPRSEGMSMRLLEDTDCVRWLRASSVFVISLETSVTLEHLRDLISMVRNNIQCVLQQRFKSGSNEATRAWISSAGWSAATYVLHDRDSAALICRREVHPWYDEYAVGVEPLNGTFSLQDVQIAAPAIV